VEGSSSCSMCTAGYTTVATSTSTIADCVGCPAGTFDLTTPSASQESPGAWKTDKVCHACAAGKASAKIGYAVAASESVYTGFDDLAMHYHDGACALCASGTYSDVTGLANCKTCTSQSITSTQCVACGTGKYQQYDGSAACVECEAGKYKNHPDNTCQSCATDWDHHTPVNAEFWTANQAGQSICVQEAQDCAYDGDWAAWSTCSVTCGGSLLSTPSTRSRSRTVTAEARAGGAACVPEQIEACGRSDCPEDCDLGDWGTWGQCDVPCGAGKQVATRELVSLPKYNGTTCDALTQERACDMGECRCTQVSCKLEHNPHCVMSDQEALHGTRIAEDGDESVSCTVIRVYHHGFDFAKQHHCYYNHIEDQCECDCPANEQQVLLAIAEHRSSNFVNLRPDFAEDNSAGGLAAWRKTHRNGTRLDYTGPAQMGASSTSENTYDGHASHGHNHGLAQDSLL